MKVSELKEIVASWPHKNDSGDDTEVWICKDSLSSECTEHYRLGPGDLLLECGVDGWISIERALPESGTNVLIYTKSKKMYTAYYSKTDQFVVTGGKFEYVNDCYTTHWMTLPKPPKRNNP